MKQVLTYMALMTFCSSYAQGIEFSVFWQDANCKSSKNGQAGINVISTDPPYSYSWSNGSTDPSVNDLAPGTYSCVVTDFSGDDTIVTIQIKEIPCPMVGEIIFTPNDDGYNDNWDISSAGYYPKMKVVVYNRWGQKVFERNGQYEPWDGRDQFGNPVPDSSYYYIIYEDKDVEGSIVKGSVSVLR